MKEKAHYKRGMLDGRLEAWYENGHPYLKQFYKDGKAIDTHLQYYPRSDASTPLQLARELHYVDGKLHGQQKAFFANGELQTRIDYKEGMIHGVRQVYNETAKLIGEEHYYNSKLDGKYFRLLEGDKILQCQYKNNKKHGKI